MLKKILFLIIAIAISITAVFVQQIMDNEFPYKANVEISGKTYSLSLPKVNEGVVDCIIELNIPDKEIEGYLYHKVYNSNGTWQRIKLLRINDKLVSILPYQKPMIKLYYYIELRDGNGNSYFVHKDNPFVVLFRNHPPRVLSYAISLLLFFVLIVSNYLGLVSAFKINHFIKYIRLLFYMLSAAVILDFISYWIAYQHLLVVPSPHNDLRIFKYLIIFILWLLVYYSHRNNKEKRIIVLLSSIITLFLFCLPDHFVFQSFF
ncbi:MAG: hypothetical protein N2662_12175 [Bacteroidales bacterium]|nr:hypothetical protein [Bacteroidales bacterium]